MILIKNVSKTYDKKNKIIDNLNLEIKDGEIFGFLGPNGAGKSTTIKMITGILDIDEGDILINDKSIINDPIEAKKNFGYVPDNPDMFLKLKGIEYLNFLADMYEVGLEERMKKIEELTKLFEINDVLNDKIQSYSHGMRQKIVIIGSLLHNPKNWIIDEPMTGLDPKSTYELKQIMKNIEFYEVERPQAVATNQTMQLALGFTTIVFIILAIIVIMIRIKDRKYLDKNIKDVKIKQYSKFGGLVLFFWTLCFYQFFLRIVEVSNVSKIEGMDFYVGAITIQNTILAIVNMYQIYLTVKRKPETPKRLVKTNILIMLIGVIITIIRIIYALIKPMEIYDKEYFKQELITLVYSIIYPLICIFYFKFSKRVQTYYYLKIKE